MCRDILNRKSISVCILLFIFSLLFTPPAFSGDFKLVKVDSHYEPELVVKPGIALPATNIKAGAYKYISDNGSEVGRLGFLINQSLFYYVESNEYNLIAPDLKYSFFNGYFITDVSGYASTSGHNRLMFLCKYTEKTVQLLDVIGQAYIGQYGMDFETISDRQDDCFTNCPHRHVTIKDVDHDGHYEIKMQIFMGDRFEPVNFKLYFEIVSNLLRVDFNPELYKTLYEMESKMKSKSIEYYIYGFLSKRLDLQKIKSILNPDKKEYQMIVPLLERVEEWDAAFHNVNGEKFILVQYNLKRG